LLLLLPVLFLLVLFPPMLRLNYLHLYVYPPYLLLLLIYLLMSLP
jgi:hypothetical protein